MPVNATYEFDLAKKKFEQASDTKEKLQGLQEMLAALPKHKGTEKIQKELKTKISKYRELLKKEKSIKKGSHQLSIKKEGAATVCILGISNSGKSSLLSKLTNAKPKISEYEFTTTKPEMGIIDYKGIKIQLIEMPPIVKNYEQMDKGPLFLSFIRNGDLLIFLLNLNKNQKEQLKLLYSELKDNDIHKKIIILGINNKKEKFYLDTKKIPKKIWNALDLIKVYTKTPGKKPDYPPVALKKESKVKNLAEVIHKDFLKINKQINRKSSKIIKTSAKIWGTSVKHQGVIVGLDHVLEDEDIVELHLPK